MILGVACRERKLFTIHGASREYSVSYKEMAVKAVEAGLASIDGKTKEIKLHHFIPAELAAKLKIEIDALMDTQDAAKYLSLDRNVFEKLARRKHIRGIRKTPRGPWKFTPVILEGFVSRLIGKINDTGNGRGDIENIAAVARRLSCKSEHIIELILKEELKIVVS